MAVLDRTAKGRSWSLEARPYFGTPPFETSREREAELRSVRRRIVLGLQLGELPPGATLEELRLAEVLRVSRTAVRESLIGLESAGHLDRTEGSRVLRVPPLSVRDAELRYETLAGLMRLAALRWGLPGARSIAALDQLRRTLMASNPETWLLRYEPTWNELVSGCWHSPALSRLTRTMGELVCRYEVAYLRDKHRLSPPTHAQKPALLHRLRAGDVDALIAELGRTWSERATTITDWLTGARPSSPA